MKKTFLIFLISVIICGFGTAAFWYFSGNSNDMRFLSDYFFLSGVAFFIGGMIIALFVTSRLHYYHHLKKKWQGKEGEKELEEGEKKRKEQMFFGAAIALSGVLWLVIGAYIAVKIGYL